MQSEQEKYYATKNQQIRNQQDAASQAQMAKLATYGGIALAAIIAFYAVLLFFFAPGVLISYTLYKMALPHLGLAALWFSSIVISSIIFGALYFINNSQIEKTSKIYLFICATIAISGIGLYVFKFKPALELHETFWFFRDDSTRSTNSNIAPAAPQVAYEIKTKESVETVKNAVEETMSQDNEKSKLESVGNYESLKSKSAIDEKIVITEKNKEASEKLLLGKWKHVSLEKKVDGQSAPIQFADGESFSEFFPDGRWILKAPKYVTSGKFKWLDGQRIEETILESGFPVQVGMISVKYIRVTENRLEIITVLTAADLDKLIPAKEGAKHPNETVITSVFSRVI